VVAAAILVILLLAGVVWLRARARDPGGVEEV